MTEQSQSDRLEQHAIRLERAAAAVGDESLLEQARIFREEAKAIRATGRDINPKIAAAADKIDRSRASYVQKYQSSLEGRQPSGDSVPVHFDGSTGQWVALDPVSGPVPLSESLLRSQELAQEQGFELAAPSVSDLESSMDWMRASRREREQQRFEAQQEQEQEQEPPPPYRPDPSEQVTVQLLVREDGQYQLSVPGSVGGPLFGSAAEAMEFAARVNRWRVEPSPEARAALSDDLLASAQKSAQDLARRGGLTPDNPLVGDLMTEITAAREELELTGRLSDETIGRAQRLIELNRQMIEDTAGTDRSFGELLAGAMESRHQVIEELAAARGQLESAGDAWVIELLTGIDPTTGEPVTAPQDPDDPEPPEPGAQPVPDPGPDPSPAPSDTFVPRPDPELDADVLHDPELAKRVEAYDLTLDAPSDDQLDGQVSDVYFGYDPAPTPPPDYDPALYVDQVSDVYFGYAQELAGTEPTEASTAAELAVRGFPTAAAGVDSNSKERSDPKPRPSVVQKLNNARRLVRRR